MPLPPGSTSAIRLVFIQDSTSTTGGGKSGLAFNTSGLTCYYVRDTDSSSTAVTLATMTLGTWATSGFKEVDATNQPGLYQFGIPNAAIAAGANEVAFYFQGATGMAPVVLGIDISTTAVNVTQIAGQTASAAAGVTFPSTIASTTNITAGTITTVTNLTNLPAITTDWLTGTGVAASAVTKIQAGLATPTNITAGTITTVTNLTNLPAITTDWLTGTGVAASAVTKIQAGLSTYSGGAVASVTGNVGGNVVGSVGSVTAAVTVGTINTDAISAAAVSAAAVTKIQAGLSTYSGGAVASVTGNVGGNVLGSVGGDVVGNVFGSVGGNVLGSVGGFTAAALAQFFTLNTTKLYADAITGSVVKETASNASGGGGTVDANVVSVATDAISAAAVSASAVTKIQAGLATPTNITAGTITTVTNLTNLPAITTDWLTGTGVAASAVTKIQAGLATPTNITAGTITTVTNLTNLPAITTDWLTGTGVAASAVTKIQAGLSTYAGGDTSGTTTLLSRLTSTRTGYLDQLGGTFEGSTSVFTAAALANSPGAGSDPWLTDLSAKTIDGTYSGYQAGALAAYSMLPDGTIASATATTATLPATDARGVALADDGSFGNTALYILAGTGRLQTVVLDTPTGSPRQYNVVAGTMPTQLDNTSRYVLSGIQGNAWTADGWIASATTTTVTLPAVNSSGLDIPDDGRYAETMIRIVAGSGAGQVPVLTTATGVPREYHLLAGSCPVPLDSTSQYQYGPSTAAELDLTKPVPMINTAQTVGDAMNAALAEGFGKWTLTGTAPATLTLYARDGTTVVRTFVVDNAAAPTSRS